MGEGDVPPTLGRAALLTVISRLTMQLHNVVDVFFTACAQNGLASWRASSGVESCLYAKKGGHRLDSTQLDSTEWHASMAHHADGSRSAGTNVAAPYNSFSSGSFPWYNGHVRGWFKARRALRHTGTRPGTVSRKGLERADLFLPNSMFLKLSFSIFFYVSVSVSPFPFAPVPETCVRIGIQGCPSATSQIR